MFGVRLAAGQTEPCDRTDAGQRLATKAEGDHAFQVVQAADLAGRVTGDSQRQLVGTDALTVVGHPDQRHPALLQIHSNGAGTGIDGVLDQFLEHGGRPLDDFTGGDLVDQQFGQDAYRHGRRC